MQQAPHPGMAHLSCAHQCFATPAVSPRCMLPPLLQQPHHCLVPAIRAVCPQRMLPPLQQQPHQPRPGARRAGGGAESPHHLMGAGGPGEGGGPQGFGRGLVGRGTSEGMAWGGALGKAGLSTTLCVDGRQRPFRLWGPRAEVYTLPAHPSISPQTLDPKPRTQIPCRSCSPRSLRTTSSGQRCT